MRYTTDWEFTDAKELQAHSRKRCNTRKIKLDAADVDANC